MGLVTPLGAGHRLIFLPVILSMVGTEERASAAVTKKASTKEIMKKESTYSAETAFNHTQ
jgi:hypothetical protein